MSMSMSMSMICTAWTMLLQDVRLSVRLSLSGTGWYSVETAKSIIKLLSPSGSHTIVVSPHQTLRQYFDGDLPNGGGGRMQRV